MDNYLTKEAVLEAAKRCVGDEYDGVEVTSVDWVEIPKADEVLEGLQIGLSGNVAPIVYGNYRDVVELYSAMENAIFEAIDKNKYSNVDLTDKSRWRLRAVNKELAQNTGFLKDVAYVEVEDLAIIPCFLLDDGDNSPLTIEVLEKGCCTTIQEFFDVVDKNDSSYIDVYKITDIIRKLDPELAEMPDEIFELVFGNNPLWVVQDETGPWATGLFAMKSKLDELREKLGDFYIIPSSNQELIVAPVEEVGTSEVLNEIIPMVNQSSVYEEEVLSDHTYLYDGELKSA